MGPEGSGGAGKKRGWRNFGWGVKAKIFKHFYLYQFDLLIVCNNKFMLTMKEGRELAILFKCQEFQLLTVKGFF